MRNILFIALAGVLFWVGRTIYFKPKYIYGQDLPEMVLPLINGDTLTTADLQGHVVLLDFWGSWCGPCRKESPELVKLYKEYTLGKKSKYDFRILSIGVETKASRWKSAIQNDGLAWDWHYTSLERFKDPIVQEFGVREIPTKFLINTEGMIVAVNPTFEEIRNYLEGRS
jgi:thiol-disulfide isomerase/thioredoxin